MPSVHIETSYLKDVLAYLPEQPTYNWLITDLDCLDHCCWKGSEKWAERMLYLTDVQLRNDVNLRNMQIIWGVFSAIPAKYSKEEVFSFPEPEVEISRYMCSSILPQHPLADFEIYVVDGSYLYVTAKAPEILKPLYDLPYPVRDEEESNRKMNSELCRIQDVIRELIPDVAAEIANEIQWNCWHVLFRDKTVLVSDRTLHDRIRDEYEKSKTQQYRYRQTIWNPYTETEVLQG